jgi:hypothetical protein
MARLALERERLFAHSLMIERRLTLAFRQTKLSVYVCATPGDQIARYAAESYCMEVLRRRRCMVALNTAVETGPASSRGTPLAAIVVGRRQRDRQRRWLLWGSARATRSVRKA